MPVELTQQLQQTKVLSEVTGCLTSEITADNALLHELQLGEKLNHCVVDARRSDFSLMLAMLAEDVREQSQFLVPQSEGPKNIEYTEASMRKAFNLPQKAPIALSSLDDINQFNQAYEIANNNLVSVQLENAIKPKPIAFRDDKNFINSEVLGNTSLLTQLKQKQVQMKQSLALRLEEIKEVKEKEPTLNQPLGFNAKAWLDSIQETIVKAPLLA